MIPQFIDFLKRNEGATTKCCYGGLIAILLWSMIAVDTHHAHTWLEKIPGFWTLFGLVSCTVLVVVARWLARGGLTTREDYYDN